MCAERSPDLQASNRDGEAPLRDGDLVEVFLPPQGGVFTELDVVMSGIEPTSVVSLQTTFVADDGQRLADQAYPGNALEVMLACRPDGWFYLEDMPVRFDDAVVLEELDASSATMTMVLETNDDELGLERRIAFTVVEY